MKDICRREPRAPVVNARLNPSTDMTGSRPDGAAAPTLEMPVESEDKIVAETTED